MFTYLLTRIIVQELCESRGGRPGLSVLTSLLVSVDVKLYIEPCLSIGLSLSLICQLTSEDIKQHYLPASRIVVCGEAQKEPGWKRSAVGFEKTGGVRGTCRH